MSASPPAAPDQRQPRVKSSTLKSSLLASAAVLSLAVAGAGLHAMNGKPASGTQASAARYSNAAAPASAVAMPSFADLVDGVRRAVVSIRVNAVQASDLRPAAMATTPIRSPGRRSRGSSGAPRAVTALRSRTPGARAAPSRAKAPASSFRADGYIVTNNHVVQNAQDRQRHDARRQDARRQGRRHRSRRPTSRSSRSSTAIIPFVDVLDSDAAHRRLGRGDRQPVTASAAR